MDGYQRHPQAEDDLGWGDAATATDDRRRALVMPPSQGEVWWAEAEDRRRPVLVVTRSEAVPVLTWIVVAPVTRTIRCIPTEVPLSADEGLPTACVASFSTTCSRSVRAT